MSGEIREVKAKFILSLLEKTSEGLRRKELLQKWKKSGLFADSVFHGALSRLKNRGYVAKKEPYIYTSPYVITEAGKQYLKGLRA